MFFQTFLDVGRGLCGSWVVLIFPYALCPLVTCSCVSLCCAYLQEFEQGCLAWKSGALLPHGSQPHLVLSCGLLLPTILVCLLPTSLGWLHSHLAIVFETVTLAPYPLGFYKEAVLRGEKWNRFTGSLSRVGKIRWRIDNTIAMNCILSHKIQSGFSSYIARHLFILPSGNCLTVIYLFN